MSKHQTTLGALLGLMWLLFLGMMRQTADAEQQQAVHH